MGYVAASVVAYSGKYNEASITAIITSAVEPPLVY